MNLFTKDVKNPFFILFTILVLSIQNLIIFSNHYFNRLGFPWDFDKSYFVTPAFWTTSINLGIFPQWIPFQSMGYPLFMKANSAFHYPFYWIFPFFNIQYTLQAAVIFQTLHVFFGSLGMFLFLMHVFKSPKYALVGAVAFQFFGGFYGNSSHVDIVRGFALLAWLFYIFSLNTERPHITKKILFTPVIIFLVATGAYPGIFIATVFIMTAFVVVQILHIYFKDYEKRKSLINAGLLFGLLFLGITLSMVHLGAFIHFGGELTRFDDRSELQYAFLTPQHFPSFFMSNSPIPGEITMSSTFLCLPILILASLIPLVYIKKYWIFFVVFTVGLLMILGTQTPFWDFITSFIPGLDLSRLVISDYRIFIVIPIMLFGIAGLKSIVEHKLSLKSYLYRLPFILGWFIAGLFILYRNSENANPNFFNQESLDVQTLLAAIIFTTTLILIFAYLRKLNIKSNSRNILRNSVVLIAIGGLITVDGFRVIYDMETWKRDEYDARYIKFNVPLEKDGKLRTYSIFDNLPDTRPERILTKDLSLLSWRGVLTGEYMMQDSGKHTALNSRTIVQSNSVYTNYMIMKWTPILLDLPEIEQNKLVLDDEIFSNAGTVPQTFVNQTYYGINDIFYQISLNEPMLMIENEMYFPGWTATLSYTDKVTYIQSIEVNDVFRAWPLPAGDYEMKASFQFPNYVIYQIISLTSFVIWIVMLVVYWLKSKNSINKLN